MNFIAQLGSPLENARARARERGKPPAPSLFDLSPRHLLVSQEPTWRRSRFSGFLARQVVAKIFIKRVARRALTEAVASTARLNFVECTLPARVFSTGLGPPSTSRNDSLSFPSTLAFPHPTRKIYFPGVPDRATLASRLGAGMGRRWSDPGKKPRLVGDSHRSDSIRNSNSERKRETSPCLEASTWKPGFARERNNVNDPEERSRSTGTMTPCHRRVNAGATCFLVFFFTAVRVARGMNRYERAMGMRRTTGRRVRL